MVVDIIYFHVCQGDDQPEQDDANLKRSSEDEEKEVVVEEARDQTPSPSPTGDEDIAEQRLDKGYAIKPGMQSVVFYVNSTVGF